MNTTPNSRKFANTLARGLSILGAFRASDAGLSHTEIAGRTGLPKPTVTRLAYTLCELGYLSHGGRNDRFRLGPAAITMGDISAKSVACVDLVSDALQLLADATGTLAMIAVQEARAITLVKTWRPRDRPEGWFPPGYRLPLWGTSAGQAVLAVLPEENFAALRPDLQAQALRREGLAQLRRRGFTMVPDDLRFDPSVRAVSVPYFASDFGAPVGFSCGAMARSLTEARILQEVGPALRRVVRELEAKTGQPAAWETPR
jgi:DNA-binding IclR family transcriptional regulator